MATNAENSPRTGRLHRFERQQQQQIHILGTTVASPKPSISTNCSIMQIHY
jgi:hypothetical protein